MHFSGGGATKFSVTACKVQLFLFAIYQVKRLKNVQKQIYDVKPSSLEYAVIWKGFRNNKEDWVYITIPGLVT